MSDQEFLVFIEEDDDGSPLDDRLVLASPRGDGPSPDALEVRPDIEVELLNRGSRLATGGLALSIFGALVGAAALATFAATYPAKWFDANGSMLHAAPVLWLTLLFAVLSGTALIVGTVMSYYGRRVEARSILRAVEVVHPSDDAAQ